MIVPGELTNPAETILSLPSWRLKPFINFYINFNVVFVVVFYHLISIIKLKHYLVFYLYQAQFNHYNQIYEYQGKY